MKRGARHPERHGRYRSYDPPPAGFDPHTAPDAMLLRHGLPRRPDPEREPQLVRTWKRIFARPLTYLKAELEVEAVMSDNPLRDKDPVFGPVGWAGAIVRAGDPFTWVFAEWVIPEVKGDKHFWEDDIDIGFWVGIDGFTIGNDQVLQAGVAATVTTKWWTWHFIPFPHTVIEWWAWTEWWTPNAEVGAATVSNFPVKPGETVSFVVCAPQPGDSASVFIAHASTGQGTSVQVDAPEGTTAEGDSAEWIVEKPPEHARVLLQFNPATFNDCWAGRPNHLVDLRDALPVNIMGASENLTDVQIEQPHSVVVNWKASE
jgi:Peptidase A4 family